MPTVLLDGIRTHYALDGAPGAPVLVLSHGLGLALQTWNAQMPALRARFRVLRYDTRGHGGSSVPAAPSSIEDLGHDVIALLDHLRIDRAHFCGLSLGGLTGMWLGVHAPQRIASLVLANTAAQIGTRPMWDTRIAKVIAEGMTAISGAAIERWFTRDFISRSPTVMAELKAMFERTPAAGYASCCAANRDADMRGSIAQIGVPTLVIASHYDVATPVEAGRWVSQRIARARYVELATAHLSNVEMPDVFATLVADHVAHAIATRAAA